MVKIKCKHCLSTETILKEKGPHLGAYCATCGKWLKWLSKAEKDCIDVGITIDFVANQPINETPTKEMSDEEVPW